jgi:transposase
MGRIVHGRQLCPSKKRGACVGKTRRGKGTKWMVVVDGQGIPLGSEFASASQAEVNLAETTLEQVALVNRDGQASQRSPERLIVDKAYDSDPLRQRLAQRGVELIAPHRRNRKIPKTQDGRKLRRYRKRWKVERFFAWIGNFRRLVVRYERDITVYRAFFHVACIFIVLRWF